VGVLNAASFQFIQSLMGGTAEAFQLTKLDGLGRTRFGASRLEARVLAVVAEGAFEGAPIVLVAVHNSERARDYTVRAAVADVRLNKDAAELGAHDGAGRAGLETTSLLTMLADVGGEAPGYRFRGIAPQSGDGSVLDKFHVAPGFSAEGQGVVIGVAAPEQAVV
jgi:hypothetical protein